MKKLFLFFFWLALAGSGWTSDIYFAPTSQGSGSGLTCSQARALSSLASGDFTPGVNFHLCSGTYGTTTSTSTTLATFSGSGTSGSPITMIADQGAVIFEAGYFAASANGVGCGGGISMCNQSYIVLNGANNLTIENFQNGDSLANQQDSTAIDAYACNNCTVENVTIANIYVHPQNGSGSIDQTQMNCIAFTGSNWTIANSTMHDAGFCLKEPYANGDSAPAIYGNNIYNIDHGWMLAAGSGTNALTNAYFHDNQVHDTANWDTSGCHYHHDGIHAFGTDWNGNASTSGTTMTWVSGDQFQPGFAGQTIEIYNPGTSSYVTYTVLTYNSATSLTLTSSAITLTNQPYYQYADPKSTMTGVNVYNNHFYGNWGSCPTAFIFVEGGSSTTHSHMLSSAWWNNNFTVASGAIVNTNGWFDLASGQSGTQQVYANTLFGAPSGADNTLAYGMEGLSALTFKDNLTYQIGDPIAITGTAPGSATIDYNFYGNYTCANGGDCFVNQSGGFEGSFSTWKSYCSCDSHSLQNNSTLFNSDGSLQASNPAIEWGTNLGSLATGSLATLANDTSDGGTRTPVARPATATCSTQGTSSCWDIGAYQYASSSSYTLTVNILPTTAGIVTASGLTCTSGVCTGSFTSGNTVTLTESPNAGYTFVGWIYPGCQWADASVTTTCAFTMPGAATTAIAKYELNLPQQPSTWVDSRELVCRKAGNCQSGSPGSSLTVPAYEYVLGTGWITSTPPSCTFSTYTLNFTGLQNFVNDMETCRTNTGVGIILDVPPGTYQATSANGLVIPQTNSGTVSAPLILRSTLDANLPNGQTACTHGLQDNLATSTDIGLMNSDCTGGNLSYWLGPTNTSGVIAGATQVSVNTTSLAAITSTGTQCVALTNGYVAPGIAVLVDASGTPETITTTSGTNQTGMCGNFTHTHSTGFTVTSTPPSSLTLANGSVILNPVSTFNDVANMWTIQADNTGTPSAITFCNANAGSTAPLCAENYGPSYWEIDSAEIRCYPGFSGACIPLLIAGAQVNTTTAQATTHVHFDRDFIHGDWTSPLIGANNVSAGFSNNAIYSSFTNSQVSQISYPGVECHALNLDAQQFKYTHDHIEGCSVGAFAGGYGAASPTIPGYVPATDGQIGRNWFGDPFWWLGLGTISTNPNFGNFTIVRKNAFELKSGQRVVIYGNIFDGVDPSGGQFGNVAAFDIRHASSGYGDVNYQAILADATIVSNIFRNANSGIVFQNSGPSVGFGVGYHGQRLDFKNNLLYNINGSQFGSSSGSENELNGNGESWQVSATVSADNTHMVLTGLCSVDAGDQCLGQISSVTISGTCSGSPTIQFPTPNLAGGNAAAATVACSGSSFTTPVVTNNGSGYTGSSVTPTLTCTGCSGVTISAAVVTSSTALGTSASAGFNAFDMVPGDPAALTQCTNTAFNNVSIGTHTTGGVTTYYPTSIGPPTSTGSAVWNGTYSSGNTTITIPLTAAQIAASLTGSETSGTCKLTNLQGGPYSHMDLLNNTYVSNSTHSLGSISNYNNSSTDGPSYQQFVNEQGNIWTSGGLCANAFGCGTSTQTTIWDSLTSLTTNGDLWVGASGYTGYGINPLAIIASPSFAYPSNIASVGFATSNLTASDYHSYEVTGTYAGYGPNIPAINTAQTQTLWSPGAALAGSPGPFLDNPPSNPLSPTPAGRSFGVMF